MPNIYLRLPKSRCQYFRNRDSKKSLAPSEPIVFNSYMHEYFLMRNSLTNASAVLQTVNMKCFSHQQWVNMLNGRRPIGGKVIVKRDKSEYLTFAEVQYLVGCKEKVKTDNEDYLCIKLPREVDVVDTVRPVTPSWNLDEHGVRRLICALNNDFKRSVVEWAMATFDFCISNGRVICRSQSATLERFLMRYGIEPSAQEKDNLRRVIDRWINTEQNHFNIYSCFDMQYKDSQERQSRIDTIQWL